MDLSSIRTFLSKIKFSLQGGYNAKKYWKNRLSEYGFDLRGVGNRSLTDKDNKKQYDKAGEVFISVCQNSHVNIRKSAVLDVGCGTGFYAQLLKNMDCTDYTGIDISDVLLPDLRMRFSDYQFNIWDITKDKLTKSYDLIIMIDVTQHITSERKFKFAMKNIKANMKENSLFITTSFLAKNRKNSFYEKSRDLNAYIEIFDSEIISEPIRFRDKYIFTIRRI